MIYTNPNIRNSYRDGHVIASFICDDVSELPATNYISDYTLDMGSTAHVIGVGDYEMKSTGEWVLREPTVRVFDAYTKSEVDGFVSSLDHDIVSLDLLTTSALTDLINNCGKNIFHTTATTSTITDVIFTNNGDGTWTANGTAAARRQKSLAFTIPTGTPNGRYILTGCPAGGYEQGIKYDLYLWDATAGARVVSGEDIGNGLRFDWSPEPTHNYSITIDIRAGVAANNLLFKPMICREAYYNVTPDFVPYNPTLPELWEIVKGYHP